jgi:hypothetical protein
MDQVVFLAHYARQQRSEIYDMTSREAHDWQQATMRLIERINAANRRRGDG